MNTYPFPSMRKIRTFLVLLLLGSAPAMAQKPPQPLPELAPLSAGMGIIEEYRPGVKQVVIDGTRFQIHVSTRIGYVMNWPGKVQPRSDLSTVKAGDQVFFDADFSKKEPYRLKYLYWLIK